MDLEKLNLEELNAQELQEVEGGIIGVDDLILLGIGALVGVLCSQDLDRLGTAYRAGYKSTRNGFSTRAGAGGSW